jgi:hypothetical protein
MATTRRRLNLDATPAAPLPTAATAGEDRHWRWAWDARRGAMTDLVHRATGTRLIDPAAPWDFAAVVTRHVDGWAPWMALDARAGLADRWRETAPAALDAHLLPSAYGLHAAWRRSHPAWRDCRQSLRLLPDGGIEVRTAIWLYEDLGPAGFWLALPLATSGVTFRYDALGHPTEVGRDQMPNTCGEHVVAGNWLAADTPAARVVLDCTDTPIVSLGGIHARSRRLAAAPAQPWLLPCLSSTWWFTNFPPGRSQLIETRHVLRVLAPGAAPRRDANLDLPTLPS